MLGMAGDKAAYAGFRAGARPLVVEYWSQRAARSVLVAICCVRGLLESDGCVGMWPRPSYLECARVASGAGNLVG